MINSIQWEYIFNTKLAIESFPYVIKGIGYTLLISFVSMFAGTVIGLFISLARMSKLALLRWPAKALYLIYAGRSDFGDFVYPLFRVSLYRH